MSQTISSDIQKILEISRFSPSSHNTQPWVVHIAKNSLLVGYNPHRQLSVGDPDKRELFMSLGCFIESSILAAQSLGYSSQYMFLGDSPDAVARLTFTAGQATSNEWPDLIISRRSNRNQFDATPLPGESATILSVLKINQARLHLCTSSGDINFLSQQTYDATLRAMSRADFRTELATWIRNNWTRQHDGMPAYVQGIPGPISLIAPLVIKKNSAVAKDQATKDSRRLAQSAAIGLITIKEHSYSEWIDAGRLYQHACLVANQYGLATAGLSAAVIDPQTTLAIQVTLKLDRHPIGLLRFGFSRTFPKASPRLEVNEFVRR